MENVVLTVHLILAVLLTGVVLLQRSEGGGLGMGGGGGGGVMTGRQAANALTRLTWIFGIAIFCTSIALTIIAARQVSNSSIMDQLGAPEQSQPTSGLPAYVPPPSTGGDPLTPPTPGAAAPATEAPATTAPAATTPAPAAPAAAPAAPAAAPAADPVTPPAAAAPETPAAETPAPAPAPAN